MPYTGHRTYKQFLQTFGDLFIIYEYFFVANCGVVFVSTGYLGSR